MDDIRFTVLRGQTVTLRPLTAADAGALAAAASESRQEFVYTRVPDGVDGSADHVARTRHRLVS